MIVGALLSTVPAWAEPPILIAQAPPTAPAATSTSVPPAAAPDAAPAEAAPPGEPAEVEGERPLGEDEAMVLNFERADIREVIHSLATALGLSYTIDPRIEGQVTIRTTGKIARKDLFPLFNEILRNNGIAAVRQGEIYHMVPVAEAKTRAIVPRGALREGLRSEDSFVIEIISLRHVAAEEMANILQPFVTPGGDVLAYPRANTVVVTDIDSNVRRLRELVATFDIDGFTNLHARVFKVKEGDPDELVSELLELLAPYGVTATGEGEAGLSLVSLSRLDAIVAFAIDRSAFDTISYWLSILDVPPDQTSGRQTFVYNVENAKAADLAAVLNELFGGEGGAGGGGGPQRRPGQPGGVGLFGAGGAAGGGPGGGLGGPRGGRGGAGGAGGAFGGRRASAGGVGGAAALQNQPGGQGLGGGGGGFGGAGGSRRRGGLTGGQAGAPGAPGAPGQPGAAGQQGQVLGVSLPGGFQGAPGAPGVPGAVSGPRPIFKEEVRIVADEVTNSLIVLATRRDYQLILDVLKRIDVVPRQVVLEVMIAEVVLNKGLEFGVSYAIAQGKLGKLGGNATVTATNTNADNEDGSGTNNTTRTTTATGNPDILARVAGSVLGTGLLGSGVRFPQAGGFAIISPSDNFAIFLNALQSLTDVKMLSAPHIIAADNREAHILVGQSIPILTSSQQSTIVNNASLVNQVQYRDTGKILTVLPQVNSQGLVNLQIRQEVSAVLQTAAGAVTSFGNTGSPAFSTREAETTVVVQDGETVLIGGIIDDSIQHTRSGIPFLMDIPVVGRAFRSDSDTVDRTELLVTITPSVIRNKDEARGVTDEYSDRIEGLTELRRAMEARRHRHMRRRSVDGTEAGTPAPQ
jgi:general secretion pathway protein D